MTARKKEQDSHVGHIDLLHNPSKCFYWSNSEDNQLNFMYRSEEGSVCVFFSEKRALTAMSAVPEQHEETAGHQVKTPGVTEQQRYLRDIRADAKYSHFVCDR